MFDKTPPQNKIFLTSPDTDTNRPAGIQIQHMEVQGQTTPRPTTNNSGAPVAEQTQETQLKSASQAHLAIYDHLPRDINVLADSSKYQEWARKVLPRISSPRQSRQPQDGFVIGGGADGAFSDEGEYDLRGYSFKYNKHPLSSRTYKEHVKGRKVKPGLHRGSVTRFLKYFEKDPKYPKPPISSPVEGLDRYETSFIHPRYRFASTSTEQIDLRKVIPPSPELLYKEKTMPALPQQQQQSTNKPRKKSSPPKCYFSISKPATTNITNNKQLVPYNDDSANRKHRMPPIGNKTKSRMPTSLSAGVQHGKQERTIPSMHEMSTRTLPDNIGPTAKGVKNSVKYTIAY